MVLKPLLSESESWYRLREYIHFLDLFRQRLGTHVRTLRSICDHFAKFWQRQPWMSTALDVEDLAGLTAEMELGRTKNKPFKIFQLLLPSIISILPKGMPPVGDKFLFSTVDYFILFYFHLFSVCRTVADAAMQELQL